MAEHPILQEKCIKMHKIRCFKLISLKEYSVAISIFSGRNLLIKSLNIFQRKYSEGKDKILQ